MSHIVKIQTQVLDATAVRAACKRLSLAVPVEGRVKLFSGEVAGLKQADVYGEQVTEWEIDEGNLHRLYLPDPGNSPEEVIPHG